MGLRVSITEAPTFPISCLPLSHMQLCCSKDHGFNDDDNSVVVPTIDTNPYGPGPSIRFPIPLYGHLFGSIPFISTFHMRPATDLPHNMSWAISDQVRNGKILFNVREVLNEGMTTHGHQLNWGFDHVLHFWVSLLKFFAHCGFPISARQVLEEMPEQDVISWTAVTQALVARGNGSGMGQAEWISSYEGILGLTQVLVDLHHDGAPFILHRVVSTANMLFGLVYHPYFANLGLVRIASLVTQIYCFEPLTIEAKFRVFTYPVLQLAGQGTLGVNVGYGPMIVCPWWLAYITNNPLPLSVGCISITGSDTLISEFEYQHKRHVGYKIVKSVASGMVIVVGTFTLHAKLWSSLDIQVAMFGGVHFSLLPKFRYDIGDSNSLDYLIDGIFPLLRKHIEPNCHHAQIRINISYVSSFRDAIYKAKCRNKFSDGHPGSSFQGNKAQTGLEGSHVLKAANEVVDYVGTVVHEFHFTVQNGIGAIEDAIYHIETYDLTTIRASTPIFLMSQKIKSLGVKWVIFGEGSDVIFGGYMYFHKAPNKEEFHKEACGKIKALHQYVYLQENKSTFPWGLEAREPFFWTRGSPSCWVQEPTRVNLCSKTKNLGPRSDWKVSCSSLAA